MSLLLEDSDTAIGKRSHEVSLTADDMYSYYIYVVSKVDEDELDLSELGEVEFVLSQEPFIPSAGHMAVLLAEARAGKGWLLHLLSNIDDLLSPGSRRCFCSRKQVMDVDFMNPKKPRKFSWSTRAEAGDIWKQYSSSVFAKAAAAPGQALKEDVTTGYQERLMLSGFDIDEPIPTTISAKSRHAKFLHTFESAIVQQMLTTVLTTANHGVELNWKREVVPSAGRDTCSVM
eukprot:CAMPEP_0197632020 /NCGR_PEP_ID=MMETSP1338-20131121/8970_1 /TAXON_ID=43686 ORGANISM="Pelagodinium beii, Strain RCC1491" /NCGR_SAMPLE_ID=MMETSP1338 /ASSEMBLY_ACC=CAM_ASM_000754 /LENGTH=230 /DNA_ID=CAMNT_0043203567 /DNA_START=38 /DNA_END=730 /DNA_ORIENTATION=+